jgi:hypothetical protein
LLRTDDGEAMVVSEQKTAFAEAAPQAQQVIVDPCPTTPLPWWPVPPPLRVAHGGLVYFPGWPGMAQYGWEPGQPVWPRGRAGDQTEASSS